MTKVETSLETNDRIGNAQAISSAYMKFATLTEKVQMTLGEAIDLSRDLAAQSVAMAGRPDLVVGLANGALLPTKVVADQLGVPFHIIYVRRTSSRYKQRVLAIVKALGVSPGLLTLKPLMFVWRDLQERFSRLEQKSDAFAFNVAGKHVLVVDDAVHTGRSARYITEELLRGGAAKVHVGVLCWYQGIGDSGNWRPDTYLHRRDQYYPWSSNSPYFSAFLAWLAKNGLHYWT